MKHCHGMFVIVLATAATLWCGCGREQEGRIPDDLSLAINAFYAAVEAGDNEARLSMFADDAIMMPNHWTMWKGKGAIAEVIRAGEGSVFRIRDRDTVDMEASGSLAYTVNLYYYTYHREGAEPRWHKTKNVHIWKRDHEGRWRLHVDIWNSDVPMNAFADE